MNLGNMVAPMLRGRFDPQNTGQHMPMMQQPTMQRPMMPPRQSALMLPQQGQIPPQGAKSLRPPGMPMQGMPQQGGKARRPPPPMSGDVGSM